MNTWSTPLLFGIPFASIGLGLVMGLVISRLRRSIASQNAAMRVEPKPWVMPLLAPRKEQVPLYHVVQAVQILENASKQVKRAVEGIVTPHH